jgi:putative membrane protein
MSAFDFESPSRQSAKGIIVIFGINAFKVLKGAWAFILLIVIQGIRSGNGSFRNQLLIIGGVLAVVLMLLIVAILQYLNFTFYLKDGHFFIKKGVLNREELSVSHSKIQNVYIKQNLLQQIVNVVSLSIETAGDDKTEISISALPKPMAIELKRQLLKNSNQLRIKDPEPKEKPVYFRASFPKLLLEGISENHLKSFLIIFAFVIGLYNDLKEIVNSIGFMNGYKGWFQLEGESVVALIIFNLTFIIALIFVSMLFSMLKMLIQNFDLTVIRNEEGLELSKGLFNKINLGLTSSRIQKTTVSTNRLKQLLGLYKLSFTQANANKKQQLNFNIVGLGKIQVKEILNQFYPNIDGRIKRHKPSKYMLIKHSYLGFFLLLLINMVLYFLPAVFLWLNAVLIILIGSSIYFTYQKTYYYVDQDYIVRAGGGLIDTWSSFLELHKTQCIQISETYFQKRRGLAHLTIYSASKTLKIPHIPKKEALNISNQILYLVESQNRDWM